MSEIGMRIYYNNKTGEILYTTGNVSGNVEETPDDRIISIFNLNNMYNESDIGIIKLPFNFNPLQFPSEININTEEIVWMNIPSRIIDREQL